MSEINDIPLSNRPSALTKTIIKRVLQSLDDVGIKRFDLVIEGNGLRVIVGEDVEADNIASRIEGLL